MENVKIEIAEETNYTEFAEAVAEVLIEQYGTHLIEKFKKELASKIAEKAYTEF
jgi:dihydroneopterin aldolase